jgi:hypothetical protein
MPSIRSYSSSIFLEIAMSRSAARDMPVIEKQ